MKGARCWCSSRERGVEGISFLDLAEFGVNWLTTSECESLRRELDPTVLGIQSWWWLCFFRAVASNRALATFGRAPSANFLNPRSFFFSSAKLFDFGDSHYAKGSLLLRNVGFFFSPPEHVSHAGLWLSVSPKAPLIFFFFSVILLRQKRVLWNSYGLWARERESVDSRKLMVRSRTTRMYSRLYSTRKFGLHAKSCESKCRGGIGLSSQFW